MIWGWGVAQYPVLLPGTAVTLTNAGAPHTTLVAIIWLFVAAVVLVGPAFALLFSLQGRSLLHADDAETALAGVPGSGTWPPAGPPGQQPAVREPGLWQPCHCPRPGRRRRHRPRPRAAETAESSAARPAALSSRAGRA